MLDAQQEVRKLLDVMLASPANSQTAQRASDQIQVLCSAYMEVDQTPPGVSFGLSKSRSKMFGLMLKRKGQTVSREALFNVCDHSGDPEIDLVGVQICHLRKAIKGTGFAIETVYGAGYRLMDAH